MSGFQRTINTNPAPAVEGDFASANPRASMLAGEGALVTGPLGVTVGRFAWALAGVAKNAFQAGAAQIGFVHRELQAVITLWLAEASMTIPAGMGVTLMNEGDFWAKFAAGATIDQNVYAYYDDGTCVAGSAAPTNTSASAGTVDTTTTLTITVAPARPIAVGQPVTGTGIPAGTYISALGTGTGGVGTYTMSAAATATGTVTVTFTTAALTNFRVKSTAAAGELAKISTWGKP